MKMDQAAEKIAKVMGEFKDKKLKSGKEVVKNPKQAMAIAIAQSKRKKS